MIDIATIMLTRAAPYTGLTPEERAQFRAEQQCSVPFCGLPVVRRAFIGG